LKQNLEKFQKWERGRWRLRRQRAQGLRPYKEGEIGQIG
jgi:hypothetical protein